MNNTPTDNVEGKYVLKPYKSKIILSHHASIKEAAEAWMAGAISNCSEIGCLSKVDGRSLTGPECKEFDEWRRRSGGFKEWLAADKSKFDDRINMAMGYLFAEQQRALGRTSKNRPRIKKDDVISSVNRILAEARAKILDAYSKRRRR
jgi:hypothetical protein